jgi:hypothetical protein
MHSPISSLRAVSAGICQTFQFSLELHFGLSLELLTTQLIPNHYQLICTHCLLFDGLAQHAQVEPRHTT